MDLYNIYKNFKIKQNILYDTYKNDSITIIKEGDKHMSGDKIALSTRERQAQQKRKQI